MRTQCETPKINSTPKTDLELTKYFENLKKKSHTHNDMTNCEIVVTDSNRLFFNDISEINNLPQNTPMVPKNLETAGGKMRNLDTRQRRKERLARHSQFSRPLNP